MNLSFKRFRLWTGWALVPVYVLSARPSARLIAAGAVLAFGGVLIRTWAAGTIHKNTVLTKTGPYAFTRNPLYLGSFFVGLGLVVAGGRITFAIAFLALFAAIYGRAMRTEAQRLERRFGRAYREYARHVPLFLPSLRPYRSNGRKLPLRFRLKRYRVNREYEAALGVLIGFIILAVKLTWF